MVCCPGLGAKTLCERKKLGLGLTKLVRNDDVVNLEYLTEELERKRLTVDVKEHVVDDCFLIHLCLMSPVTGGLY